jgi:hypothetical protein
LDARRQGWDRHSLFGCQPDLVYRLERYSSKCNYDTLPTSSDLVEAVGIQITRTRGITIMAQITFHSATSDDQTAMAAMRKIVEPNKGRLRSAAARGPYDEIMNRVGAPEGVTYKRTL